MITLKFALGVLLGIIAWMAIGALFIWLTDQSKKVKTENLDELTFKKAPKTPKPIPLQRLNPYTRENITYKGKTLNDLSREELEEAFILSANRVRLYQSKMIDSL